MGDVGRGFLARNDGTSPGPDRRSSKPITFLNTQPTAVDPTPRASSRYRGATFRGGWKERWKPFFLTGGAQNLIPPLLF